MTVEVTFQPWSVTTAGRPNGRLRFVERDGKRVLQQQWELTIGDSSLSQTRREWRDVPLEVEEDQ